MLLEKYLKLLFCFFFLLSAQMHAQQQNLNGIVVDGKNDLPLGGVTVQSRKL
jgi:hypothetical protein